MIAYNELYSQIIVKKSFLCVGLDTDPAKIPQHLLHTDDPIFEFNKAIVDATHPYTIAYKPNIAFYEAEGVAGWLALEKTVRYIKKNYPEQFLIADAKRGDIGNTSHKYAKAFFENLPFDAITVAPYMGEDSVTPFLKYHGKWVILLALTSNEGASDFQLFQEKPLQQPFYKHVLKKAQRWATEKQMMFVVGATKAGWLQQVRQIAPNSFLLVPGVGAQGGRLYDVAKYGMNKNVGLIVNSSRAIIYADSTPDFAQAAASEAKKLQQEMATLLRLFNHVS